MSLEAAVNRLALAMETQNGLVIEMLDRLAAQAGDDNPQGAAQSAGNAEQPAKRGRGRPRKEETSGKSQETPSVQETSAPTPPANPTEPPDDDLGLDDEPAPTKTYTLEEVRAKLIEVKNSKGADAAKTIIQAHVASGTSPVVGNIPADKFGAVVAACQKAL